MHARRGRNICFAILMVLAGAGLGCDWAQVLGDPDVLPPPPSSPPSSPPPRPDAAAPTDGPAAYDLMCRHYCQALEETDLLVCVSSGSGGDADACKGTIPTADSCFDLRCASRRVDVSLCLTQCDSLARFYDARCPVTAPSSDALCPASQADHDAACRAGCAL